MTSNYSIFLKGNCTFSYIFLTNHIPNTTQQMQRSLVQSFSVQLSCTIISNYTINSFNTNWIGYVTANQHVITYGCIMNETRSAYLTQSNTIQMASVCPSLIMKSFISPAWMQALNCVSLASYETLIVFVKSERQQKTRTGAYYIV